MGNIKINPRNNYHFDNKLYKIHSKQNKQMLGRQLQIVAHKILNAENYLEKPLIFSFFCNVVDKK